jgi:2-phospho-L-lactate guanylyltransferase
VIAAHCWALVPLRDLAHGKERLAGVLDAAARRGLIEAMARDVVEALRAAGFVPARVLLVSEDAEVAALATALGVGLFRPAPAATDPLNAALAGAAAHAAQAGAQSVLMLHADLPLAGAAALRELCATHAAQPGARRATLVTDRAGEGSNCLLLSPPLALRPGFGAGSRARHRAAATVAGVDYREFIAGDLAFDVDFAADLGALVRLGETPDNACGAHTRAWLARQRAAIR